MKLGAYIRRLQDWLIQYKSTLLVIFFCILVLQLAVQLLYPYDRALPLAQLRGQAVGLVDRAQLIEQINDDFAKAKVEFVAGDKQTASLLTDLGASVQPDAMVAQLTGYTTVEKLLPFSIFFKQPTVANFKVDFNKTHLSEQATKMATKLSIEPVNAGLAIDKDGQLAVTNAKVGQVVDAKRLQTMIQSGDYSKINNTVEVNATQQQPEVDDASIADVKTEAERVLEREINIVVTDSDQTFKPTRAQKAKMLSIEKVSEVESYKLGVKSDAVKDYVQQIWEESNIEPSVTEVKLVDGKVADKQKGKKGLGIDRKVVGSDLSSQLLSTGTWPLYLYVQRGPIESPISYSRQYTSSQAGLSSYVDYVTQDANIKLSVTQLGGSGWQSSGNSSDSIPSASTYKLYVMLKVFDAIKSGQIGWNSKVLDINASTCFERIIVVSSNACAEAWIDQFGRREINSFLSSQGFSDGTSFTGPGATRTTANDLNKLLIQLENGTLVSSQHKTMLLEKMHRQIYRQGVPAGTSAPVYNKVGFLWDYRHDAAIVRHSKGSYVIVVMTKDQSWQKIAEITRQVERILYG